MRLLPVGLIAGGVAAATLAQISAAAVAPASSKGKSAVVVETAKNPKLGTILVTTKGFTLYLYTLDKSGKVACTGKCATFWPPLVLPPGATKPAGGKGVRGLGTVRDPDGKLQVTFKGHPLYRFVEDKKPGSVLGQGVEKTWFVLRADARTASTAAVTALATPVSAPPGTAAPATAPPTTPRVTAPPATAPQATTPAPRVTSPPATSPPATSPPATSPPVTSPPITSPPMTSPPPTSPPATTVPAGGGVAY
jgi:predicted lipoprotein with Yx(FWY)xxD motif